MNPSSLAWGLYSPQTETGLGNECFVVQQPAGRQQALAGPYFNPPVQTQGRRDAVQICWRAGRGWGNRPRQEPAAEAVSGGAERRCGVASVWRPGTRGGSSGQAPAAELSAQSPKEAGRAGPGQEPPAPARRARAPLPQPAPAARRGLRAYLGPQPLGRVGSRVLPGGGALRAGAADWAGRTTGPGGRWPRARPRCSGGSRAPLARPPRQPALGRAGLRGRRGRAQAAVTLGRRGPAPVPSRARSSAQPRAAPGSSAPSPGRTVWMWPGSRGLVLEGRVGPVPHPEPSPNSARLWGLRAWVGMAGEQALPRDL